MKTLLAIFLSVLFLFFAAMNVGWIFDDYSPMRDGHFRKDSIEILTAISSLIGIVLSLKSYKDNINNKDSTLTEHIFVIMFAILLGGGFGWLIGYCTCQVLIVFWPMVVYGLIYGGIDYWYENWSENRKIDKSISEFIKFSNEVRKNTKKNRPIEPDSQLSKTDGIKLILIFIGFILSMFIGAYALSVNYVFGYCTFGLMLILTIIGCVKAVQPEIIKDINKSEDIKIDD
jgi:hypothetical protein